MKILLDTHAFLWFVSDAPQLSKKAKRLFLDENNLFVFSIASVWEMAIKTSLGKLHLEQPFEKFVSHQLQENAISILDIQFRHLRKISILPFHHRDPFDRLIICQAIEEDLPVLSSDKAFDDYEVERLW